jgi:hypothetical protein
VLYAAQMFRAVLRRRRRVVAMKPSRMASAG